MKRDKNFAKESELWAFLWLRCTDDVFLVAENGNMFGI